MTFNISPDLNGKNITCKVELAGIMTIEETVTLTCELNTLFFAFTYQSTVKSQLLLRLWDFLLQCDAETGCHLGY